jgi:hypothetical protein
LLRSHRSRVLVASSKHKHMNCGCVEGHDSNSETEEIL